MSVRTLRSWMHDAPRRCGRPPRAAADVIEAAARVESEWKRQGREAGYRPVARLLPDVPLDLVQETVRRCKQAQRRHEQARRRRRRVHTEVEGKDVLWGIDETALGPGRGKRTPWALVVVEQSSGKVVHLAVGDPATGESVVAALERIAATTGRVPLVLQCDNGGCFRARVVKRWAHAHGMIVLHGEPHTPEHNARTEHVQGELKRDSGLGARGGVKDPLLCQQRLEQARVRLDACRPRAALGWRTRDEADRAMDKRYNDTDRQCLFEEARRRMERAVQHTTTLRARRRAQRHAILGLLEEHELIKRWRRDGSPVLPKAEGIS